MHCLYYYPFVTCPLWPIDFCMTPIQYTLGLHWTGLWATGNTLQRLPESYKAGIISRWNLLDHLGVPMLTSWDHLCWLCVTLWQNTAAQCGNVPHVSLEDAQLHSSMCLISGTVRRPVNSITMVARSHQYWTTSSTTQSCHRQVDNLITQAECHRDWPLYDDIFQSFTLLHFAWNRTNHCGATCRQLMSQVGGVKTGNRLRWSIPL